MAGLVCAGAATSSAGSDQSATDAAAPRKPAPDADVQPYRKRLEELIRARYPNLLSEKLSGTPVVTVLLEFDGAVAASHLDVSNEPLTELTASEGQFAKLGIAVGELRYVGIARVDLPLNTAFVVFGARNSRQVDRALVARFFPNVLTEGVPKGQQVWILFDPEGRELARGEEFISSDLRSLLTARYPGIRISSVMTDTVYARDGHPLTGEDHQPLQLHCAWLTSDSPLPKPN
jgi:hypothetical protein